MKAENPLERVERIKNEYTNYLVEIWKYGYSSAEQMAEDKIGYYEDRILIDTYFQMEDLLNY